jgi:hypothetical protein
LIYNEQSVKLTIIIAVGLIIAGGILSRLGISLADWEGEVIRWKSGRLLMTAGKITSITADCDSLNIDVFPAVGNDISLSGRRRVSALRYKRGERCSQGDLPRARKWYEYLRFGFRWGRSETYTLSIGLPSSYRGPLNLHTASGKIDAGDFKISGDFTAEASSGVIDNSNVIADGNILLEVSSGNIRAEG